MLIKDAIEKIDSVLGVCTPVEEAIPQEVLELVEMRQQARKDKQWQRSDEIRAQLQQMGYAVDDGPQGVRIKKIN